MTGTQIKTNDARNEGDLAITKRRREGRGWGPFSGTQLTIVIVAVALVLVPTAAMAAVGTFTSTTATPAVNGTNSSTAANAKGVEGIASGAGANTLYGVTGAANASTNGIGVSGSGKKWGVLGLSAGTALNASGLWGNATAASAVDHFGVWGSASGTGGIGVKGTGAKYGVFSNGPLGIASGKSLSCATTCLPGGRLAAGSVTAGKLGAGSVAAGDLAASAKATQPLASGESESGVFGTAGGSSPTSLLVDAMTFVRPLSSPLTGVEDVFITGFSANCPGQGSAAPGYLCLYGAGFGLTSAGSLVADPEGVVRVWGTTGPGPYYVSGPYTVTSA